MESAIQKTDPDGATEIADMVGELLAEIANTAGIQAFNFNVNETTSRLADFLVQEKYFVFLARGADGHAQGFISIFESYALYTEGEFGTIAELYVRPEYRSHGVGQRLISQAKALGVARGWTRLEVTTPPLPQFDRTLAFYEREGFAITGGRKLKVIL